MLVEVRETKKIAGSQTIVSEGAYHFLVSSVKNPVVDKTFIVKCDEKGKVEDWNEVYTVTPSNHETTVDALENGMLTISDFNFMDKV